MSGILINPYKFAAVGGGGGTTPFVDDFDDNSIDPVLWLVAPYFGVSQAGVTLQETSQHIVITPAAGSAGNHYNTLTSVPALDFSGRTLEVDISSYTTNNGDSGIQIFDNADTGNNVQVSLTGSSWFVQSAPSFQVQVLSIDTAITTWRVRHIVSGNKWEFSTYKSGVWSVQFTTTTAESWTPTNIYIVFYAGTFNSEASPGIFIFDNVVTDATY